MASNERMSQLAYHLLMAAVFGGRNGLDAGVDHSHANPNGHGWNSQHGRLAGLALRPFSSRLRKLERAYAAELGDCRAVLVQVDAYGGSWDVGTETITRFDTVDAALAAWAALTTRPAPAPATTVTPRRLAAVRRATSATSTRRP